MEQDQNVKRSYLHYITSNWKELRATSQPPPHEEEDDPRMDPGADSLIGKTFIMAFVFGGEFCVCDATVDSESGDKYLLTFEKDGVEEEYLMDSTSVCPGGPSSRPTHLCLHEGRQWRVALQSG